MGTVHQDTPTVFLLLLSLFPMDMPWAEGVAGPLLPCPQLGGNTIAPQNGASLLAPTEVPVQPQGTRM